MTSKIFPSKKRSIFAVLILIILALLLYRLHSNALKLPAPKEDITFRLDHAFSSGDYKEVIKGARRLLRQNDFDPALGAIERLLNETGDPQYVLPALQIQAGIYHQQGDLQEAKDTLRRLINDFPETKQSRAAHFRLAGIYSQEADYTASYLELFSSGLLMQIVILNFLFFLAVSLLVSFLVMLTIRFFFKKKAPSAKDKIFMPIDFYVTIALSLISPWLLIMIMLPLNLLSGDPLGRTGIMPELFCMTASGVLLMVFCLLFLKKKYKLDNRTLGFFSLGIKYDLFLPILVVMATISIAVLFSILLTVIGVVLPETMNERIISNAFADQNNIQMIFLFVVFTLIGPVSEEIVFRVFIQNFLKKHTNTVFAIIVSSILFAAFHQSVLLMPYFFIIGVILALLYTKTKSIIPSIVTHGIYNLIFLLIGITSRNAQ